VQQEDVKITIINDGSVRERVVHWSESNKFGSCSCKLFETMGIPCRHIILTLRGEKLYKIPSSYILRRWEASFGQIVPTTVQATQEEYKSFIGCKIPDQVEIHPPIDVRSNGMSKRIKRVKEVTKPRKGKNAATLMKEPPQ
jgi:hypothetical protein